MFWSDEPRGGDRGASRGVLVPSFVSYKKIRERNNDIFLVLCAAIPPTCFSTLCEAWATKPHQGPLLRHFFLKKDIMFVAFFFFFFFPPAPVGEGRLLALGGGPPSQYSSSTVYLISFLLVTK